MSPFLFSFLTFLGIGFLCFMCVATNFLFLYSLEYFLTSSDPLGGLSLNFSLDWIHFFFLVMVLVVSSGVMIFSQFYLELYDNNKFIFLLLIFIFSMLFLIQSSSIFSLAIGWDFLGASSVFLVMFYPNKITSFNSFLTFYFNRISDIFMILCFSVLIVFPSNFFFLQNFSFFLILCFCLCSFIKSAQFPFSSWLPAAMSAPTPVSALVHSSTLVTAGILVLVVFLSHLKFWHLIFFLEFFCCAGIMVGGLLAVFESDLKKIVAFSTMSQISVVLVMTFSMLIFLSMTHMFFHALFKSFLFVTCGFLFLSNFSSQLGSSLKLNSKNKFYLASFWVTIFSMTGLIYSVSFWTKDLFMEFLSSNFHNFFFFFFFFL